MKIKDKKFLFITLNENLYTRQKYIIELLQEYIEIDIFFLEDIFHKYSFFYIKGLYINSFWPDSYAFNYFIFKKIILETVNPMNYSGLIVTYDWSASIKRTVQIFKDFNIPTFNILHEGFYINIKDWYNMNKYLPIKIILKTNKSLDIPVTDYSFVWWDLHKKEFLKRGYKGKIESIGTFKFEKYKQLQINKNHLIKKLGILNYNNQEIFLYAFQILKESQIQYQYKIINDLIRYCQKNNQILIVRNQIGYNLDINKLKPYDGLYLDGIDKYIISAEEAILISDSVFAINSTMLLEGIINNKHAFSFKYFDFTSPFLDESIVKTIKNKNEIYSKICQSNDSNFINQRNNEIKGRQFNGDISLIIKNLEKNGLTVKSHFLSNKNIYGLKYLYLFINPFLVKNFFQSLYIYIKKAGKKY